MTLHHRLPAAIGIVLILSGCAEGPFAGLKPTTQPAQVERAATLPGVAGAVGGGAALATPAQAAATAPPRTPLGSRIFRGTGLPAGQGLAPPGVQAASGEDVTLSFNAAESPEVARVILGDTLGLNYAVDAAVTGQLTLETSQPVPRNAVSRPAPRPKIAFPSSLIDAQPASARAAWGLEPESPPAPAASESLPVSVGPMSESLPVSARTTAASLRRSGWDS